MKASILSVAFFFVAFMLGCMDCSAAVDDVFLLVTGGSSLHDGDEVVIVNSDNSVGMSAFQGNRYVKACRMNVDVTEGTAAALTDSLCLLKLEKAQGGWKLARGDGKYLVVLDSSSENLYFGADDNRNISVASFSFGDSGDCLMDFRKHYVKFTKSGGGRFGSYSSPKSVLPIQLYRKLKNPTVYDVLTLHESGGNAQVLSEAMDARAKTVVIDRRFVGDGGFYTICLPVELTENDLLASFPGAAFYCFSSVAADGDASIVFHFKKVSRVAAGEPCIMRLADGSEIETPRLYNKIVMAEEPGSVSVQLGGWRYSFIGTFDPVMLDATGAIRFLGSSGKCLVTPNKEGYLSGLRCYFSIPDPSKATGMSVPASGQQYVVALDDTGDGGMQTSAGAMRKQDTVPSQNIIYNIGGERINNVAGQLPHGLYIIGGRKVVRK